ALVDVALSVRAEMNLVQCVRIIVAYHRGMQKRRPCPFSQRLRNRLPGRWQKIAEATADCGLVLCTKHSRPDCPCRAIRGQTESFRATAARKYLVSLRIADCAPGLAAGFDSFTVSCTRFCPLIP